MHRRILTFVLVLALCGPLAVGATNADMDPNGAPAAEAMGGTETTFQTEHAGLQTVNELSAWFGSLWRGLVSWWGA